MLYVLNNVCGVNVITNHSIDGKKPASVENNIPVDRQTKLNRGLALSSASSDITRTRDKTLTVLPCMYCSAERTSPCSARYSTNDFRNLLWPTVSLSHITARWRRARVMATLILRSEAKKPTSPEEGKNQRKLVIICYNF